MSPLAAICLFIGIGFGASLFHFVPIWSKSNSKYANELASNEELMNISQVLFDEDTQNFLPRVRIDYQGFLNSSNINEDRAPGPLLSVDESVSDVAIIKKMKVLYDNYEANSTLDEQTNSEEDEEVREFITALLDTAVMKIAMEFLERKGLISNDPKQHFDLIKRIWFDFYPRNKNTTMSSSGFEHVFLSEVKKGKIIGLHNWIYFAEAEKQGELNYKGWMKLIDLGDKAKIVKVKFSLNGLNKSISSFFVGTTPELELALYTICFKLRANRGCKMAYNDVPFNILTYSLVHDKKRFIGSAYVNV